MNTESIYQFLEDRRSVSEEVEKTMASILEKHPWFGGGQLLYALMKKQSGSPDADAQMAKAQLFLSNPLWANWQTLQSDEQAFKEPEFILTKAEEITDEIIENSSTEPDIQTTPTEEITIQETENITTEPAEKEEEIPAPPLNLSISLKEEPEADTPLSFEPLHTVDYFASQGIRLKQEQLGNDQLSKQVKTFTQWLQTMKKMYHTDQHTAEKTEDKSITKMADASNESGEIITETMAEVLLQQGKTVQAMALFEKLSLLHPEKSSYFTARISELKK